MTQSTVVLFDLIKKVYIIGYELFFISKMKKNPTNSQCILSRMYSGSIGHIVWNDKYNNTIRFQSQSPKFQPQTSILQFYTFNIMHRNDNWCVRMVFCPINILSANVWGFFKITNVPLKYFSHSHYARYSNSLSSVTAGGAR